MKKRKAYFISELVVDSDGGYIPCIAVEGEKGYYKTDWNWGNDLNQARKFADDRNERLGITPKEALLIQLSTM